jgi:PIN domain nuclease of toxin-antitoxin system
MKRYVIDTQCLLWYIAEDRRLPKAARSIFRAVEEGRAQILVPSIALVEAVFLLQRQRVSEAVIA